PAAPAAISGPSSGTRAAPRRSGTGCCTCKSLSLPCICPDRTQQAVRSGLFCRQTNCKKVPSSRYVRMDRTHNAELPRRTGSGGAAGCRRSACGCSVCQRGGSGHAGADAGAQGAGVLRDDLHRAAVVQPQQAQQALGVGDLAVGVVDAHVAVQAAGRMNDLVDLADVIDAYFLDHKGTFLSVRVWYGTLSALAVQAEAPACHAGIFQGGLQGSLAAERIQNQSNIFHGNFSFLVQAQAFATPSIARVKAPAQG